MTPRQCLATLAVLTLLAPLAGADPTATGTLRQGETHTYVVDHEGDFCAQVITTDTVTLTHEPTTDELLLVVPGHGAQRTEGGFAQIAFTTPSACASFTVHVIGVRVADEAHYTLDVQHGPAGGGATA